MPEPLVDRLRARGFVPPDYTGRGLLNVPATVLDILHARDASDPPALAELDPALRDGVTNVVVILADGLGSAQLERLCASGDVPFLASLVERARRRDRAQLLQLTSIFPSTTTAAITSLHTARSPQEHGNIAYFLWLEEFGQVTQMLRWGPAITRRGSYFDDPALDATAYAKVGSIHQRLRERGATTYLIEPEIFRLEPLNRMHAREAIYTGYVMPSGMGVCLRRLLDQRPHGSAPAYAYAYWAGIDTASHQAGPRSAEHAAEAAAFDLSLRRAFVGRERGDTLVLLTADHGHAATDPDKLVDLQSDQQLAALLRNPLAGEPRCVFFHTDQPDRLKQYIQRKWPDSFFVFDREEAIAAGLFGRGDPALLRRRVGEVCALLVGDRGAVLTRVDGQIVRHLGSHGGMSADEMNIPLLAWRA